MASSSLRNPIFAIAILVAAWSAWMAGPSGALGPDSAAAAKQQRPQVRIGLEPNVKLTRDRCASRRTARASSRIRKQARRRVARLKRRIRATRRHARQGRIRPAKAAKRLRRLRRAVRRSGPQSQRRLRQVRRLARTQGVGACRPRGVSAPPAGDPTSMYWGAWLGKHLTGTEAPWDMDAARKFEQLAGKDLSIVHFSSPFANCYSQPCSFYDFPEGPMDSVREHGAIPFFSWASQSIPAKESQPEFQLADVLAGNYDSYIREFAEDARDWGHPFFLRFNWEMNGSWFAWSERANGNRPGESVAVWRHVHDIFASVGADNATWVWCPNVDPYGDMQPLEEVYPGEAYVDWTCLDGYSWGTNPAAPKGWLSFDGLFRSTYEKITTAIAPGKPMVIGETSASEYGGSKAAWIADALAKLPADYPLVRGLVWFEKHDDGMDWPIESSDSALDAFATGIGHPAYRGSDYGSLETPGPIPPPA